MRSLALALLGATFLAAGAAEAQDNRLHLTVKPRSWLDAGSQVEVGSMQSYMYDQAGYRDFARFGARGSGSGTSLTRPGDGIAFYTPQWWTVR